MENEPAEPTKPNVAPRVLRDHRRALSILRLHLLTRDLPVA